MSVSNEIGRIVELLSYKFKPGSETDFDDGVGGSWYVSPTVHGVEFLTFAPFYLTMTAYYGYKAIIKDKTNFNLLTKSKPRPSISWLELICLVTMTASYSVTIIHKMCTGTEIFLLQPCHMSAALLIIIMVWPNGSLEFVPQVLFNIYLHTLWGSVLALVFPDLRDHDMLGEIFNFFLEHILILVLPFYMMLTKRYIVLPLSKDMALFSFYLYASYHSPLLHAVSLWSGYNVNYTLVPPTLGFLIQAGRWYRLVMCGSALILMLVTRYVTVETFLKMFCRESQQMAVIDKKRKKNM